MLFRPTRYSSWPTALFSFPPDHKLCLNRELSSVLETHFHSIGFKINSASWLNSDPHTGTLQ